MDPVTLVLKDGNTYTFSDVPIGYFRRFRAAIVKGDDLAGEDAGLDIITASLQPLHSDITKETVEMKLISMSNYLDAIKSASRASSAGEVKPTASN